MPLHDAAATSLELVARWRRHTNRRYPTSLMRSVLAGSITVLCLSAGCGGDDASVSVDDYCRLAEQLDEVAAEAFGSLEPSASQGDFNALFAQVVVEHGDDLQRLEALAPDEIRADVAALNELTYEAIEANDLSILDSGEGAEIDARIQEFERETCNPDGP